MRMRDSVVDSYCGMHGDDDDDDDDDDKCVYDSVGHLLSIFLGLAECDVIIFCVGCCLVLLLAIGQVISWEFPAKAFAVSLSTDGSKWIEAFATDTNVLNMTHIPLGYEYATKAKIVMHEARLSFRCRCLFLCWVCEHFCVPWS